MMAVEPDMTDPEIDAAVRLATPPTYELERLYTPVSSHDYSVCSACGAIVHDMDQHDAWHTLIRGLVVGLG